MLIIGKSKALKPNGVKEIKAKTKSESNLIHMAKSIAKDFGQQSKKQPRKKFILK